MAKADDCNSSLTTFSPRGGPYSANQGRSAKEQDGNFHLHFKICPLRYTHTLFLNAGGTFQIIVLLKNSPESKLLPKLLEAIEKQPKPTNKVYFIEIV